MYCKNCGKKLNDNAKFCDNCGMQIQIKTSTQMNNEKIHKRKGRDFKEILIGLSIPILLMIIVLGVVLFEAKDKNTKTPSSTYDATNTDNTNKQGQITNTDKPNLFSRKANVNDIVIDSTLDLSSFGGKYTILPQSDINNLEITLSYLDKNKNVLISEIKYLGNVKKGVQINFSISLFDLSVSVAYNTRYESITVTGGTVSYFA